MSNSTIPIVVLLQLLVLLQSTPVLLPLAHAQIGAQPVIVDVRYPISATMGEMVQIEVIGKNSGDRASVATLSISFPGNNSNLALSEASTTTNEIFWPGEQIWADYGTGQIRANYPLVEGEDTPWPAGRTGRLVVYVSPTKEGILTFYVKMTAKSMSGEWQRTPQEGAIDQQKEFCYEYTISIRRRPPPVDRPRQVFFWDSGSSSGDFMRVSGSSSMIYHMPVWYRIANDLSIQDISGRKYIPPPPTKVIPLISDFSGSQIMSYLSDQAKRRTLVKNIGDLLQRENFQGVNIDIEFNTEEALHREGFTRLIAELSSELKHNGKILTVDVPAKTSDEDFDNTLAFDYRSISIYADYVIVMAYDYSHDQSPPGPIAPAGWLRRVISYALRNIPREKLVLGIPLYAYDWHKEQWGWEADYLYYQNAVDIRNRHGSEIVWSEFFGEFESQAPYFAYIDGGNEHTMYFEDERSVDYKLEIASSYNVENIAFWFVEEEDDRIWSHVKDWASMSVSSFPIEVTVAASDAVFTQRSMVRVTVTCTNYGSAPITIISPNHQIGIAVSNSTKLVYEYSGPMPAASSILTIEPGSGIFFEVSWNQFDRIGRIVDTGKYTFTGKFDNLYSIQSFAFEIVPQSEPQVLWYILAGVMVCGVIILFWKKRVNSPRSRAS
ncbi:MAG: glycosyl hydrolase family 18 protein [archaeon]